MTPNQTMTVAGVIVGVIFLLLTHIFLRDQPGIRNAIEWGFFGVMIVVAVVCYFMSGAKVT